MIARIDVVLGGSGRAAIDGDRLLDSYSAIVVLVVANGGGAVFRDARLRQSSLGVVFKDVRFRLVARDRL